MIRKFRVLGLTFIAALAMTAVTAGAAQAIVIEAASYPTTIDATGEAIGEAFNTEAGEVKCAVSHYDGTLTGASSTLTVKPTYTTCTAFGFAEATVNTEECHYLFHATEHVAPTFRAHVDVVCPAGQSIKIIAGKCKAEVKAQTGLTTVDITNMAGIAPTVSDLTIKATLGKGKEAGGNGKEGPIAYTVTEDGFLCPFNGTGAKTGGEYTMKEYLTVTAGTGNNLSIKT
jgi:hypothetical protein